MSKVFKVFLASSGELAQEREAIKELINNYQNVYIKFEIVMWEDMSKSFTPNGIQEDTINPALKDSDIVITLFHSKVGKFTKKEFDIAFDGIMNKTKPNYLFFYYTDIENEKYKISPKDRALIKEHDEVLELIDYVTEKEQVPQEFDSIEMLKSDIEKQLRLIEKKELNPESEETTSSKVTENKEQVIFEYIEKIPKICIYTASPLNSNFDYEFTKIARIFRNFDTEISHMILNENNLLEHHYFDYCFLFTKSNNEKIIIEDDFFMQKSITLIELMDMIDPKKTKIFLDRKIENNHFDIRTVENDSQIKKIVLNILYKELKISSGQCKAFKINIDLPDLIDKKNLINFVGRNTDIENVIKKILTIKNENMILTLKGSGGIGKTTLISKVVVELAKRGKFCNGIKFIQCEFIKDYEEFENKISFAFDMSNAINFRTQLKEQVDNDEQRLIILDNVETILHIEDTNKIIEFIKFISDYSTIVITSREKINEEFEDIYDVKDLSTDEAEQLFLKLYPLKEYDKKLLRIDILENLLNKNPLAIKLITTNYLSKNKNLAILKKELDESFFDITSSEIEKMFENESDTNIERTASLFNSINYSYLRLNAKEKLALELLSLFPDGLHFESFKYFYNQKFDSIKDQNQRQNILSIKKDSFSDRDLKSLEDKSLIINNNQIINIQSIIGRFADFQFSKRNDTEKANYYKQAYIYNAHILYLIHNDEYSWYSRVHIFDENKNNFLKCLDYMQYMQIDIYHIKFIRDLTSNFLMDSSPNRKIIEKLNKLKKFVDEDESKKIFLDVFILVARYYYGDFFNVFNEIQEKFPLLSIMNNSYNEIDKIYINQILNIYGMEGEQFNEVKYKLSKNELDGDIFFIGEYSKYNQFREKFYTDNKYYEFEYDLNIKILNIMELKKYISLLYKTQFIEKVQSTYILLKADKSEVSLKDIKKLIVTNPFTDGLKTLMLAVKSEVNNSKKIYEDAIEKLYHIRYYHVDAILLYCKFLKEQNDGEYEQWLTRGKDSANKHHYRFLLHQFNCLETDVWKDYNEDDYPLPEKLDYTRIMKKYNLKGQE